MRTNEAPAVDTFGDLCIYSCWCINLRKVSDAVLWLNDNKWSGGESLNTPYNRDELAPTLRRGWCWLEHKCRKMCICWTWSPKLSPQWSNKVGQRKNKDILRDIDTLLVLILAIHWNWKEEEKRDQTRQHETQIKYFQHINHWSWSTFKQEFSSAAFHLIDDLKKEKKKPLLKLSSVHAFKLIESCDRIYMQIEK